ncbi:hypothetical protein VTP01DRAFT_6216 [Rhizomucor pusillus]|uniref:uncharacterized protein n=1 Tax=Rhizomucor pusillus TaxID=4840 RepID=UPI00374275D0
MIAQRAFPAPVNLTCAALIEDNDSIPAIGCFAQQAPCPSCNDVRAGITKSCGNLANHVLLQRYASNSSINKTFSNEKRFAMRIKRQLL